MSMMPLLRCCLSSRLRLSSSTRLLNSPPNVVAPPVSSHTKVHNCLLLVHHIQRANFPVYSSSPFIPKRNDVFSQLLPDWPSRLVKNDSAAKRQAIAVTSDSSNDFHVSDVKCCELFITWVQEAAAQPRPWSSPTTSKN